MSDIFENIKTVVDSVLGEPKRDYCGNGGWYEYNCPCCTDEKGYVDNKYNFAVQIDEDGLWGHCWRCGYHGKLLRVIKNYGSPSDVSDYKEEINALKDKQLFTISGSLKDSIYDLFNDEDLELPVGYTKFTDATSDKQAKDYLNSRGVDNFLIERFNIGYVGPYKGKNSKRIVIPSYDQYGDLNYYIARDYTGENKWKILNPDIDKKSIIFNEHLINWYEPVTIVEGPFDHIVVPNSIPLLGKSIDEDYAVYKAIVEKSKSIVNILLDDDAVNDAYRMYKFLNSVIPGRVRVIECPDGYDASDYHRDFGRKGIVQLMRSAHKLDDYTLSIV